MRKAIDHYYGDNGHYPRSLSDLVPKYLRQIPPDPVMPGAEWALVREEEFISDVRSASDESTC